ncbi:hypothetical protein COOONC_21833 [Cooperia oncophora]
MQYTFISLSVLFLSSVTAVPKLINDSALLRHKRQTYYLCGVFPYQYYSTTEVSPHAIMDVAARYPNPNPPPSTDRFGYCPSGQLSEVRCSGRGQCQPGQTCMNGLCCTTTGNEWNGKPLQIFSFKKKALAQLYIVDDIETQH